VWFFEGGGGGELGGVERGVGGGGGDAAAIDGEQDLGGAAAGGVELDGGTAAGFGGGLEDFKGQEEACGIGGFDLGVEGDFEPLVEVGGGEAHALAGGLDEDVFEDGQGGAGDAQEAGELFDFAEVLVG
jgi:hypothetical protein